MRYNPELEILAVALQEKVLEGMAVRGLRISEVGDADKETSLLQDLSASKNRGNFLICRLLTIRSSAGMQRYIRKSDPAAGIALSIPLGGSVGSLVFHCAVVKLSWFFLEQSSENKRLYYTLVSLLVSLFHDFGQKLCLCSLLPIFGIPDAVVDLIVVL